MSFGPTPQAESKEAPASTPTSPSAASQAAVSRTGQPLVRSLDQQSQVTPSGKSSMKKAAFPLKIALVILAVLALAGFGTGVALARFFPAGPSLAEKMDQVQREEEIVDSQIRQGAVFGVPDEKTFKDQTDGVLISGGLEGEGSHTLLREGGASQNVYLTSSVVDLDQFEGMEIRVWGETFKGQKAGWLMDVGRVEVMNTSGTPPAWYTPKETAAPAADE